MRRTPRRALGALLAGLLCSALAVATVAVTDDGSSTPTVTPVAARPSPTIAGCPVFPADNFWNRDIRRLKTHRLSARWLSHMSTGRRLHPDFGPSYGEGPDYGIPVTVVGASHPRVPVSFTYADESDRVGYPFGSATRIEGGRDSGGDMHAIVVDRDSCRLYETWNTRERDGRWTAGSGATWSLRSNTLRPDSWTSADAAGLPILPGLLRWSEVKSGRVNHAIRFTTNITGRRHVWPARHDAGSQAGRAYPPMGARFRLKAKFRTAGYGYHARVVLTAMKRYGLVLADNGSPWFFQGEQHPDWPPGLIAELKRVPASAFVAVDTAKLRRSHGSAATR